VRRDLPWRRTTDPYAILVSEVMLQQTQVARVLPRYEAWLERWPTAADLAAAPRADVLAAWVGLGYNARALRLWEACRIVARDGWPDDLRALPGVGPYTAAAVGSFAFGRQEVAVDTNVARVMERFGAGLAPPDGRAADFNQAMMELGATVCTARAAGCDACPVAAGCASRGAVVVAPRRASGSAERFEDTNRYVRGRVVAALASGERLPEDVEPQRVERAVSGLVHDGLVVRLPGGLSLG
jgi:A/G-specific adenine glycosylase